jgi:hypothetical protein
MSKPYKLSQQSLDAITAALGYNDGANNGFWRHQWRDRFGRWVEMGRGVLGKLRMKDGSVVDVRGVFVGGTTTPGFGRVLVEGQKSKGIPDGIYHFASGNGEEFNAIIPEETLIKEGVSAAKKDTLGNDIGDRLASDIQDISTIKRDNITSSDRKLATEAPNKKQAALIAEERAKSPIAKLPAGTESRVSPQELSKLVSGDSTTVSEPTNVDPAIKDAFDKAMAGDTTPNLDSLIQKAKINAAEVPVTTTATPATSDTAIKDLQPGDVIKLTTGDMKVVSNTKHVRLDGSEVYDLKVEDPNGRVASVLKGGVPSSATLKKYNKPAATAPATPAKPADVTPTPATPAAPKVTKTAKATVPTISKPAKAKDNAIKTALAAGREDKGQDIAPNMTPLDEMRNTQITPLFDENGKPLHLAKTDPNTGKLQVAEDPNSIINALLEKNPQAVVGKDGAIILERGTFTDTDGTDRKYEVAVLKTHDNKFQERYTFTDPATGESQAYYHYDYKDSFSAIYGDKNGVYVFRDQLLGRAMPGDPNKGLVEKNKWFGPKSSLERRIRYFRNKSAAGKNDFSDEDLTKTAFKLHTPEESIRRFLEGQPRELNLANNDKTYGSVLKKFYQNFWEVLDQDSSSDNPQIVDTFVQLLGHMPDNEESRNLLVSTLRAEISKRYNGTPRGKNLATFANNMEKVIMSDGFDIRDITRRPWASRDGRTIVEKGDKIRYFNNEGETSIGTVLSLNPSQAGYDDTVRVRFANGVTANILAAKYMDRLTGTDEFDTADSKYTPSLQGEEMLKARGLAPLKKALDFGDLDRKRSDAVDNSQNPNDIVPVDTVSAIPYLGDSGVAGDKQDSKDAGLPDGNVTQLDTGSAWYSADGTYLGSVVETADVDATDGGAPGIGVFYMDENGDEHLEVVERSENRSPK